MILGEFPASRLAIIGSLTAMASIIICQYIAVKDGHQPPFPHSYISKTAQHYPEFVYFRVATISAAVNLILSDFINYFWLKTISYEAVFNISAYKPIVSVILGTMGVLFLFISTATIDTGRMDNDLHVHCATLFFICTILSQFYNTFVCWMVHLNSKAKMSKINLYLKTILSLSMAYQIWLGSSKGIFQSVEVYYSSDLSKILEYTLAFSVLVYTLLMAYDVRKFKMRYRYVK